MVTIPSLKSVLNAKPVVLGLDAYGVIYNDDGCFNHIHSVFDFCASNGIQIYIITNNVSQTPIEISNKLHHFGLAVSPDQVISSGCGCYELPHIKLLLNQKNVFVYGYPSSQFYAKKAGANIVDNPQKAEAIVLAASLGRSNFQLYHQVFNALVNAPTMPVICANTDHVIMNQKGLKPVMGRYAHQMARQLNRNDWHWIGKPYSEFSTVVQAILTRHGHDPSNLVFCDDNPNNARQIAHDLSATGVLISDTGIASCFDLDTDSNKGVFQLARCCI
jgi:ribonucleotide monophosphatase NagD (HAD superfamily)